MCAGGLPCVTVAVHELVLDGIGRDHKSAYSFTVPLYSQGLQIELVLLD
jgi:hypothetical protein